jgi:hypothetical protein
LPLYMGTQCWWVQLQFGCVLQQRCH